MKSPMDMVRGKIVDFDPRTNELIIKAYYPDWRQMMKRDYRECNIQLIDNRPLSDKQRKACYSLLREISNYSGMGIGPTKEAMKRKFLAEELQVGPEYHFSLSDAPMSLACSFQRYLVRHILDWDIPCSFPLLDFVDDVSDYLYACLLSKKCCVCGKPADLHHVDSVGAGRDREEIIHEGMEALPACRIHHTEAHKIGKKTFMEKYHIPHGIVLDATLCKLYDLNYEEDLPYAE